MSWTLAPDVRAWLAEAGAFLRSRPAAHTILLTVSDALSSRGPHLYGDDPPRFGHWRSPSGAITGALMQTPPHRMHVSPLPPEAVAPLAELLAAFPPGTGIDLESSAVPPFVAAWRERAGRGPTPGLRTRLYRLERLAPPVPPPGRARPIAEPDREVVAGWVERFTREAGQPASPAHRRVDEWLAREGLTLWEHDGRPVSMAAASQCVAGSSRIYAVYTPPEHRGRGYAAAVTVEATRRALSRGAAEMVLFTDVANPTSNAIYQRIGYRPVHDRVELRFDEG
ncbi:GNAT family N-acetyltransferase [Streptomyces sp. 6N223]|uniref:GNAT family N-acetyltransferase n=1 Tax=Streptomyces sp. 6N223 TaxID=3457412 RepID=UPI003FD323F5